MQALLLAFWGRFGVFLLFVLIVYDDTVLAWIVDKETFAWLMFVLMIYGSLRRISFSLLSLFIGVHQRRLLLVRRALICTHLRFSKQVRRYLFQTIIYFIIK